MSPHKQQTFQKPADKTPAFQTHVKKNSVAGITLNQWSIDILLPFLPLNNVLIYYINII